MAYLTFLGATTGPPTENTIPAPALVVALGPGAVGQFNLGRSVVAQDGCEACHKIGDNGNDGPGPELTQIGSRIPAQGIARTLVNPTEPMPSYGAKGPDPLTPKQFAAVVYFLSSLK
jgi:mono/diheme cytochrome c family protein